MAGNGFSFDSESNSIVRANGDGENFSGQVGGTSGNTENAASGAGNETNSGGSESIGIGNDIPKKKRGRKAFPRDENGNIIRPAGSEESAFQKGAKLDLGFTKNDRVKVRQQIQGIHAAVAILTKQPVIMLSDDESIALSNALCDVLDYHKINLTQAGGQYGLYMTLIITAFGIYKPRVDAIKRGNNMSVAAPSAPTSPGEVRRGSGVIDLSGDIASYTTQ